MLGFLEKLTLSPDQLGAADLEPLRAAGLSDEAIEDAIHVCAQFNIYTRLADSLQFRRSVGGGLCEDCRRSPDARLSVEDVS